MPDPATVLGLLAEEDRLKAVAALALGARTPAEVAARAGIDLAAAGRALARLASGGLVEHDGGGYRLLRARFREAFDSIERSAPPAEFGRGPDQDRVLRAFVRDGRLTSIPVARSKRLVVLDYLAGMFEPGRIYPEKEVNERLRALHPDVAALRRYLVDEEFLERRDGFYWRVGGSFEV